MLTWNRMRKLYSLASGASRIERICMICIICMVCMICVICTSQRHSRRQWLFGLREHSPSLLLLLLQLLLLTIPILQLMCLPMRRLVVPIWGSYSRHSMQRLAGT